VGRDKAREEQDQQKKIPKIQKAVVELYRGNSECVNLEYKVVSKKSGAGQRPAMYRDGGAECRYPRKKSAGRERFEIVQYIGVRKKDFFLVARVRTRWSTRGKGGKRYCFSQRIPDRRTR